LTLISYCGLLLVGARYGLFICGTRRMLLSNTSRPVMNLCGMLLMMLLGLLRMLGLLGMLLGLLRMLGMLGLLMMLLGLLSLLLGMLGMLLGSPNKKPNDENSPAWFAQRLRTTSHDNDN